MSRVLTGRTWIDFANGVFKRKRFALLGLVAAASIGLTAGLYVLASQSGSTEFTGQFVPGNTWEFPKIPEARTTQPIYVNFEREWRAGERLNDAPSNSWKARMTALCELARLGDDLPAVLLEGLEDRDPEVRNLAIQAAGYMGDPSLAPQMERLMKEDPDGSVRIHAAVARVMLGGAIPEELAREIHRKDPIRMTHSRLELAMKRGPEFRSDSIRTTLAAFDLHQMDTAHLGQPAPDFSLVDQGGRTHRLSDYRGKKDVVLVFIYGVNCFYCSGQMANLRVKIREFEAKGAQVLIVESHEEYRVKATIEASRAPSTDRTLSVLSDPSHTVAATYGVAMQMNHVEWLNRPSSFIIDRDGILRYARLGQSEGDRPDPETLLFELDKLHPSADKSGSPSVGN